MTTLPHFSSLFVKTHLHHVSTIRTIIIDDSECDRILLSSLLDQYCPQVDVLATAAATDQTIRLIEDERPTCVIINIEMLDSHLTLLTYCMAASIKIIFTASDDSHALLAFKWDAIDYLLKPLDAKSVLRAIGKLQTYQQEKAICKRMDMLMNYGNFMPSKKITIQTGDGISVICPADIVRLEADRSYCTIHLSDGEKIFISKPLKDLESRLNKSFFRVHATHLINTNHIKKYIKSDGGYVVMNDGSHLPVARRRKQEFLDYLTM